MQLWHTYTTHAHNKNAKRKKPKGLQGAEPKCHTAEHLRVTAVGPAGAKTEGWERIWTVAHGGGGGESQCGKVTIETKQKSVWKVRQGGEAEAAGGAESQPGPLSRTDTAEHRLWLHSALAVTALCKLRAGMTRKALK